MRKQFGWILCLTLAVWASPARAGDKVVEVGPGIELKGQIKGDEPKARVTDGPKSADFPAQLYTLKLEGGKSYKIAMNAAERGLDTFLILQDATGKQLAYDDDGGMGLNSLLEFTPAKTGAYKLYAASLSGTGQYTLSIAAKGAVAGGGDGKDIAVGKEIKGNVKADDPKVNLEVGGMNVPLTAKEYSVKLEGGKGYTISMNSSDMGFDPILVLQDKDGKQVGFDDDGGGGLNSLLRFTPTAAGTYKLFAASLNGQAGGFELKVTAAGGGGDGKELVVGKGLRLTGTLNAGTKEVTYLVKMEAGKSYRIDHMSGNFDCWLEVRSPDGKVLAEDDDGGEGLNSRIIFRAPANGTFRVVATSLGRIGMGNFVTEVREE